MTNSLKEDTKYYLESLEELDKLLTELKDKLEIFTKSNQKELEDFQKNIDEFSKNAKGECKTGLFIDKYI